MSCFAIHSIKARPYFRKYQELSFCRSGCEFLSDLIDLYFWANHNDMKLSLGTSVCLFFVVVFFFCVFFFFFFFFCLFVCFLFFF